MAVGPVKGGDSLQLVMETNRKSPSSLFKNVVVPIWFKSLLLCRKVSALSTVGMNKSLRMGHLHSTVTLIGLCMPLVTKRGAYCLRKCTYQACRMVFPRT